MSPTATPERAALPAAAAPETIVSTGARPGALVEASAGTPEPGALPAGATATPTQPGASPVPREVTRHLLSGTSALGLGVFAERGFGFLANVLAARLGGASTFGAYSLAITTAANISTYASGGIGATAARFSGKYPYGGPTYPILARALIIVSLVSATLAAAGLWLGAGPLATLLHKPSLAPLLGWAALSAAGMILLECARGFFVGQRRLRALLLLSGVVGFGMLLLLPAAALHHSPVRMVLSQGAVTGAAVLVCLALARPLGLLGPPSVTSAQHAPEASKPRTAIGPMLREIWAFGMVQLAGLAGINLAGWWMTTLIARADATLVQMSFFAIANQLRNIVGLAPSLLTESSYAIMARETELADTPDQVMALCTYLSTISALLLSGLGILVIPWGLSVLYGGAYRSAAATAALGLAVAVVHMGNAPAAARLTILSIRTTGVINTIWAVFVAIAGTALLLGSSTAGGVLGLHLSGSGSAGWAMAIYLLGHLLSAVLVLAALARRGAVPRGLLAVFATGTGAATALAALACWRTQAAAGSLSLVGWSTGLMLALLAGALATLVGLGRRYRWLPSGSALRRVVRTVAGRLLPPRAIRADGRRP